MDVETRTLEKVSVSSGKTGVHVGSSRPLGVWTPRREWVTGHPQSYICEVEEVENSSYQDSLHER